MKRNGKVRTIFHIAAAVAFDVRGAPLLGCETDDVFVWALDSLPHGTK